MWTHNSSNSYLIDLATEIFIRFRKPQKRTTSKKDAKESNGIAMYFWALKINS